jgi:SsrA-binding protein
MKTLIHNRKAHFDYEIIERFQAGMELSGSEAKALRDGQGSLEGAYIIVRGGEAWLTGMYIPPYQAQNIKEYDPARNRKLLLTKDEIEKLSKLERGLTIIPILVYSNKRWIKIEIAAVKGKKKFDKRQTLKKRDTERQIRREHTDR